MSDYSSGNNQRHLLDGLIIFCATSLITATIDARAISTGQPKPSCGSRDDIRCCGSSSQLPDMDYACCLHGGALYYVRAEKCDSSGNMKGDPTMMPCGDQKYGPKNEGCCSGHIYGIRDQKCCMGDTGGKPIPIDDVCCNGVALEEGEMCCGSDTFPYTPVDRQHPSHTDCCVDNDAKSIMTYNSNTHYCDFDSGKVHSINPLSPDLLRRYFEDLPLSSENQPDSDQRSPGEEPSPKKEKGLKTERGNSNSKLPGDTEPPRQQRHQENPFEYDEKTWCLSSTELAEGKECCGEKSYHPSEKTCCENILHDIPSSEAQCCGNGAFRKDDPNNTCMAVCGSKSFNRHTQICCGNLKQARVFNVSFEDPDSSICCGDRMISTYTHTCCASQPLKKSRGYNCCQNTQPYHVRTMSCDPETGNVDLRDLPFRSIDICRKKLVRSEASWRQIKNFKMFHFRGIVQRCGIKVRPKSSIIIPLTPVITLVGGTEVSDCLQGTLKLVIKLNGNRQCNSTSTEMKSYLQGAILDVYVSSQEALECRGTQSKLVINDGDNATILMSKVVDSFFKDALRL